MITEARFAPPARVYWAPLGSSLTDASAWTLIGHLAPSQRTIMRRSALHSEYHRRQKRRKR
jgi:hypothetical protein